MIPSIAAGKVAADKTGIFLISLFLLGIGGGFFFSASKSMVLKNMKRRIILLPIGRVEDSVLNDLKRDLKKTFGCEVERQKPVTIPKDSLNPARCQYNASRILGKVPSLMESELEQREIVLGITEVDLYAEGLNFVFGEAEVGGRLAVISLARLHQTFYSFPENRAIFLKRAKKEAVHELGHVFGLAHCSSPRCVMFFSNSLLDTDRKSASFCSHCRARLEEGIS